MERTLKEYRDYLYECEKSESTVKKYLRDAENFLDFCKGQEIGRGIILEYKESLAQGYERSGANSMLCALNSYLTFIGKDDLHVKLFRIQKKVFCPEERELTRQEYQRLVKAARSSKNTRLSLVLQTICATGMRVSELSAVTVESAMRGEATVSCKGKTRSILLIDELCKKLLQYAKDRGITEGCIFITRNGRPLDRSNIWREMKELCREAGVNEKKVFPHNLRHLFARIFYEGEKDIAALSDILGHSSINTTRIYIISSGKAHRRKMENMNLLI